MIDLGDLGNGNVPGIPPDIGKFFEQAAVVRLESKDHQPGITLKVRGDNIRDYILNWTTVSEQTRRLLREADTTTENGAIGVAFAVVHRETGFAVSSAHGKGGGGGFDYWLADETTSHLKARLEVTGISEGTDADIRARKEQKIEQIERSDSWGFSGLIVVVEFRTPLAEVETK